METVVLRALRGSGARGLASLYAASDVVRPLLALHRCDVSAYAAARDVPWVDDPSNRSPRYFRNRVRADLLPALRRVHPSIDSELLDVARRAAAWRREVETYVARRVGVHVTSDARGLDVEVHTLTGESADGLAVLWPAIAARCGVTLDRRGTERLVAFTRSGRVGARMQLSGGWEIVRSRDMFQLRASTSDVAPACQLGIEHETRWAGWAFRPGGSCAGVVETAGTASAWHAWLPTDGMLQVRRWQPGDAMMVERAAEAKGVGTRRKVKRLLSDAGVTGHERATWPVVVAGDQIVWVPGVRRGSAAAARSGRPGLTFICEHRCR